MNTIGTLSSRAVRTMISSMPCHWKNSRWLACAAGCLVFVGNVAAQEEDRLIKKPKPAPEAPAGKPGTTAAQPSDTDRAGPKSTQEKNASTGESLKEDLLDLLLGPKKEEKKKPAEPTGKDPLDSAIEGMRSAQKRMLEKDAGQKTREIQQQVLDDLEKLIQQAKQPPPSPPSGSPPPPSGNNDEPDQSPQDSSQRKPNPQPMPENAPTPGESSKSRTENEEKSKASSDESREAKEREAQLARRRDFVKDVWGHLPPAVRQKLLNVADERALPRYDELVRRYFESIAEQGTRNSPPPANRRR